MGGQGIWEVNCKGGGSRDFISGLLYVEGRLGLIRYHLGLNFWGNHG